MKITREKHFANGIVYAAELDGWPVEFTDTFLPSYTKDAIGRNSNCLRDGYCGTRLDRWMIGVSVMSGCPVGCKFCATGLLKRFRPLTAGEIVDQVLFVVRNNYAIPREADEFKINYTRMGEPFLNIAEVRRAIQEIDSLFPYAHHYISTIGIRGSDFSWIRPNMTLQVSLHSLDEGRRDDLIPFKNKMSLPELGRIRTESDLKTTLNLTLVDELDFDINTLKKHFDPARFFIKLSPINPNPVSRGNQLGHGAVKAHNIA